MEINEIETLPWDSKFFDYPVARIILNENGITFLERIFARINDEDYRLIYLFVPPDEGDLNAAIRERGAQLMDRKVTFSKRIGEAQSVHHTIEEYSSYKMDARLVDLALQAGQFSRFRRDPMFIRHEYERLYTEWLRRSLLCELALKTFVARDGDGIVGFITLKEKKGEAEIGLVAVDKSCRGQGIGPDLIRCAENEARNAGFNMLQVVTQMQNEGACRLYQKCGFQIVYVTNVYHFWNSK